MALNLLAPRLSAEGFHEVLCIKVTITFITDVVYIFNIRMFILFCEEEESV